MKFSCETHDTSVAASMTSFTRAVTHVVPRMAAGLFAAVALAAAANYSGSVLNSATGKPIPGAIVTVGATVTRADANGHFEISANGSSVLARAYGYGRTYVTADAHGAKHLELRLSRVRPHAVYLSYWGVGSAAVRRPALRLASDTPINAVVIDVKDDHG
ncbi:MAG: putative glycoside hydrolase, partial [Bryobacteraceae bacterium]